MRTTWLQLVLVLVLLLVSGNGDSQDAAVLRSLKDQWQHTPPSWDTSNDPCDSKWEGIICNDYRVTELRLSSMGLLGQLNGEISGLTKLRILDLSYNRDLAGPVSPEIGNLKDLTTLILAGCHFTGNIPNEIGNLTKLSYLALNSNYFTGKMPPSLGKLSNLTWLDVAENQLSGPLPVSTSSTPGLDMLHNAQHFHFNKNKLSGNIPAKLFSSEMKLIHILFDGNELNGSIPSTLGLVKTLLVLRLDRNFLSGEVPSNLNNLTDIIELNLANNQLTGPIPNLTTEMTGLNHVDLRNNSFDKSEAQIWFSTKQSLTILLSGNPVCNKNLPAIKDYCLPWRNLSGSAYFTSYMDCGTTTCPSGQKHGPQSCDCAYPYKGTLYFNAPSFRDFSNRSAFQSLEKEIGMVLGLTPGSVSLQNLSFTKDDYLRVHLELFPTTKKYFNRSEIQKIGFGLSCETFGTRYVFRLYYFIPDPYPFQDRGGSSMSTVAIIGLAVGCALLVVMVVGVVAYAVRQKKRAERAIKQNKPFASWGSSTKDSGEAPQLKGPRCFSYVELKSSTNNFSESNEIGSGGYGKVYKGILPGQQIVAIKRAQQGSIQGGLEFKTEIELLSRVHHKNLVNLIGFCFEKEEQMLVYEYVPNGTLKNSLSGRGGVHLDWNRRLRVALSSARGLAYLHELTDPGIIHRDVKSSNILLDENLSAKVADFGLSKLVAGSSRRYVSTKVKGTPGYIDPEYYLTQQLSEKSDVYSFGVVMLELVTAKPPLEKGKYVVQEVKMAMNPNDEHYGLSELMDPIIRHENNVKSFRRFVNLALQCVEEHAKDRPMMSDVVKEIETMLQNEGAKTDTNSPSSSATDYGTKNYAQHHPCIDIVPKEEKIRDSFDNSGGYTLLTKVEPK